jgi:uncharacterized protein YjiS (DUF1127 family)
MRLHLSKIDAYPALTQSAATATRGCCHIGRFVVAGMFDPIRRRIRRRAGEQAMMQLDDHLLRDIGLTRSQVHAAANGVLRLDAAPRNPAGGAQKQLVARRLALAAVAAAALGTAPELTAADDFARLPALADLPAGTVKVSPAIPGMGEHWANPKDLPLGPIYCAMHGKVVCAEFMVSQKDFANGRSLERLRFGLRDKQPPIDHLELKFQPHGHEGFEIPHYDLHMYFISPEARFSEQTAIP